MITNKEVKILTQELSLELNKETIDKLNLWKKIFV